MGKKRKFEEESIWDAVNEGDERECSTLESKRREMKGKKKERKGK